MSNNDMPPSRFSYRTAAALLLAVAALVPACTPPPRTPLLAEAEELPRDEPDPRVRFVAHACDCGEDLVCCNETCGVCARPGEPCPAVSCF